MLGTLRWRFLYTWTAGLLLALSLVGATAKAVEESSDGLQLGLAAYQKGDYSTALESFQKALQVHPGDLNLLHNLALTRFQMNDKGSALALWRKALSRDPNFEPARAGRDLVESTTNMRPWERQQSALWMRRALERLSFPLLIALSALLLAACGRLWAHFLAARRNALEDGTPMPALPVAASLLSIAFITFTVALVLKYKLDQTTYATILDKQVSVRSLPTDEGVALFELSSGQEVRVRARNSDWLQIQTPEGTTGWVKPSQLLITSDTSS